MVGKLEILFPLFCKWFQITCCVEELPVAFKVFICFQITFIVIRDLLIFKSLWNVSVDARVCCVASVVSNSVTPWTAVFQAPLSVGFLRQECWSGCRFLPHLYYWPYSCMESRGGSLKVRGPGAVLERWTRRGALWQELFPGGCGQTHLV